MDDVAPSATRIGYSKQRSGANWSLIKGLELVQALRTSVYISDVMAKASISRYRIHASSIALVKECATAEVRLV